MKQHLKYTEGYWTCYKKDGTGWVTDTGSTPKMAWDRMNKERRNRLITFHNPRDLIAN
jgi:hypothetical protein